MAVGKKHEAQAPANALGHRARYREFRVVKSRPWHSSSPRKSEEPRYCLPKVNPVLAPAERHDAEAIAQETAGIRRVVIVDVACGDDVSTASPDGAVEHLKREGQKIVVIIKPEEVFPAGLGGGKIPGDERAPALRSADVADPGVARRFRDPARFIRAFGIRDHDLEVLKALMKHRCQGSTHELGAPGGGDQNGKSRDVHRHAFLIA